MKKILLHFPVVIFMLLMGQVARAQFISRDVVGNAAETFTTTNLSITSTIGEPYGELLVNANANLFMTTGFAQPDIDIQNVLSNSIPDALVLFPNPTSGGTVKLSFNHMPNGVYRVAVIDASGKTLSSQDVTYSLGAFAYLPIDVSQLSGGIYFIRVYNAINFQGQVKLLKL